MSKKNHSNYAQNNDLNSFANTGIFNRRLDEYSVLTQKLSLSFDAMTIVENLNTKRALRNKMLRALFKKESTKLLTYFYFNMFFAFCEGEVRTF